MRVRRLGDEPVHVLLRREGRFTLGGRW